jgi:hypothetical protein
MASRIVGRRYHNGQARPAHRHPRRLELEPLEVRVVPTGTWTSLANLAPSSNGTGTMMLLSDGTAMVQGGGSAGTANTWYQLTPNASGSYVNGTWSQLSSMRVQRLYFVGGGFQRRRHS